MNGGCGCGGANPAGSAGPQAILPLNGVLSPLISGRMPTDRIAPGAQIANVPGLAATPEAQEAAQAQVFSGQTGTAPTTAKKSNTSLWVILGVVAAGLVTVL